MPLITTEELLELHLGVARLFSDDGDPIRFVGPREEGLPDAAVHRAHSSFGDRDFYPSGREKAAALVHAINSSHVFRDGNKRTSVATLALVLDRDGWWLSCDDDEVFGMIVGVATPSSPYVGDTETVIRAIASWIRQSTTKKQASFGDTKTTDFMKMCEDAGGSSKESGGSWVVSGPNGRSVRISRSTHQLTAKVVEKYRNMVGLGEAQTGLAADQFYRVAPEEAQVVLRYRSVMARLAAYDRTE